MNLLHTPVTPSTSYLAGMQRLLRAVQELSMARELADVQRVVRQAARELTGCDGATFVLRDGDRCHYADEDAIAPLWKGQRFPMNICISGWAMLNRQSAVIPDIYADPRIPHEAYRPTFVKSLVMVPIRQLDPVGAIGNYWAAAHQPTEDEIALLQALADATSVAMENVRVNSELAHRARAQDDHLRELDRETRDLEDLANQVGSRIRDLSSQSALQ
jgi:GAF domain-containing protein